MVQKNLTRSVLPLPSCTYWRVLYTALTATALQRYCTTAPPPSSHEAHRTTRHYIHYTYYTALHCTTLHYTHYTTLHYTAVLSTALLSALHCTVPPSTALHGNCTPMHRHCMCTVTAALHCTAVHCCTVNCIALHCTTQHTTPHTPHTLCCITCTTL